MTVGRKLKRNVFIDTDIDCQNCGCWQRVCTWNGECDNLEPLTNEEWIRTATFEELMEFLFKARFDSEAPWQGTSIWEWLKEIHDEMS